MAATADAGAAAVIRSITNPGNAAAATAVDITATSAPAADPSRSVRP
jgi:hypothetical protein